MLQEPTQNHFHEALFPNVELYGLYPPQSFTGESHSLVLALHELFAETTDFVGDEFVDRDEDNGENDTG